MEGTGENSQTGYSCYAGTSGAVLLYYRHTEEAYAERHLVFWVGSYKKKPKGSADFVSPRRRKDKERKVVLMKKIFLVLAILLIATPTWAGVTIEAAQTGPNEVTVTYDCDDPNLVRAFAVEISLTNDANIGPVTDVHPEYHVYPGSIVITGGVVTVQGTPVVAVDDSSIIVELGSLYADQDPVHTAAPSPQGTMLKFTVSESCHVDLAPNQLRGGVVMEDTTQIFDPEYFTFIGCDVEVDGGCQCMGDAYVSTPQVINIDDLSAIVAYLGPYSTTSPTYTAPVTDDCMNLVSTTPEVINIDDLSALVAYLGPYSTTSPAYTAPCP